MSFYSLLSSSAAVLLLFYEKLFVLSLLLRFFSLSLKFITFIMLCLCKVLFIYCAWSSYNFLNFCFASLPSVLEKSWLLSLQLLLCPTVFLISFRDSNCTCIGLFTRHLSSQLWSPPQVLFISVSI